MAHLRAGRIPRSRSRSHGRATVAPSTFSEGRHTPMTLDFARIAQDLQIRKVQVESVVQLLDEGNTVPFITRYRKERTGGLNEEVIRNIQTRVGQLRQLADRKQTILKSIEDQGKLTDELRDAILAADTPKRLEDLYLPYKPKKRTPGDRGPREGPGAAGPGDLEPRPGRRQPRRGAAHPGQPGEGAARRPRTCCAGVQHILAEMIAETADVRAAVRGRALGHRPADHGQEREAGRRARGWSTRTTSSSPSRSGTSRRTASWPSIAARRKTPSRSSWSATPSWSARAAVRGQRMAGQPMLPLADHPHARVPRRRVADDALTRLLLPSLEREIRRELTERAEDHAVHGVRPQPAQPAAAAAAARPARAGHRSRLPHRLQARGPRRDRQPARRRRHLPAPAAEQEATRPRPSSRSWSASISSRSSPSATAPPAARRRSSSPS